MTTHDQHAETLDQRTDAVEPPTVGWRSSGHVAKRSQPKTSAWR
jgi:hypothetical protein